MMEQHELPLIYRQIFGKLKDQVSNSSNGLKHHSLSFIEEFAYTYLRCLNILSQIRAHPQWQAYLKPCQKLLVQANVILYPEENVSAGRIIHNLWVRMPAQLWRDRYFHLVSLLILLVTTFIGFIVVLQNFEMASVFIPEMLRSSHEMEAYLFSPTAQQEMLTTGREGSLEEKSFFATFLLINNTRVAIVCFVTGFLYGIPTVLILVQTGLMLGTFPALFYGGNLVGLGAWLLPHGVPELSAIVLAGGAGLKLGFTMLNPGDESYGKAIRNTLKALTSIVIICTLLLIWAAFVESFVRQSHISNAARYMIAIISLIPLALLFVRAYFAHKSLQKPNTSPI